MISIMKIYVANRSGRLLSSMVLSLLVSMSSQALTLTKGEQYEVCRDLLPYLDRIEKQVDGGLASRPIFTQNDDKFTAPEWKEENETLGLKVKMQRYSLSERTVSQWKRLIKSHEKYMKPEYRYRVESSVFDINNDGSTEVVLRGAVFIKELNGWDYNQDVITSKYNLDFNFQGDKNHFSSIPGEVFIYGGRTFSVTLLKSRKLVYEFFTSPHGDYGISKTTGVCEFK